MAASELTFPTVWGEHDGGDTSDALDSSALAAMLSVDYPLLDHTLILAMILDYDSASLSSQLPTIRDQLAILEASMVLDPEEERAVESDLAESVQSLQLKVLAPDPTSSSIPKSTAKAKTKSKSDATASSGAKGKTKAKSKEKREIVYGTQILKRGDDIISASSNTDAGPSFTKLPSIKTSYSTSASGSNGEGSKSTGPSSVLDDSGDAGVEDDLALLGNLFPTLAKQVLREALSSEPSVPAAIDHLLSVELIRHVQDGGQWEAAADDVVWDTELPPPLPSNLLPPAETGPSISLTHKGNGAAAAITPTAPVAERLPKARGRRKAKLTIPLVDTLQRGVSPAGSAALSRASSPHRIPQNALQFPSAGLANHAWHKISSLAAYLAEKLEQPSSYFLTYLHSPEYYSSYSAVTASLDHLPAQDFSADRDAEETERAMSILNEIYASSMLNNATQSKRTIHDLQLCIKVVGADVAVVMDLMDMLSEISTWPVDDDIGQEHQYTSNGSIKPAPPPAHTQTHVAGPKVGSRSLASTPVRPSPQELPHIPLPFLTKSRKPPEPLSELDRLRIRPRQRLPSPDKDRVVVGAKPAASATTNPTALDDFGSPSLFGVPMTKSQSLDGKQIHPLNWKHVNHAKTAREASLHPYAAHIPSYARGALPHDPTPGSLSSAFDIGNMTVEECLARAAAERAKRESSIRLAGRHYTATRGGNRAISGAVAGTYALRARESEAAAREWELRAARLAISSQLSSQAHSHAQSHSSTHTHGRDKGPTIDLHNLTIHEAKTVVLEVVERWYEAERAKHPGLAGLSSESTQRSRTFVPERGLTVITGVGRHSAGQKGVLGPAVGNALEENGWRVDRGEAGRGYMVVRGKRTT